MICIVSLDTKRHKIKVTIETHYVERIIKPPKRYISPKVPENCLERHERHGFTVAVSGISVRVRVVDHVEIHPVYVHISVPRLSVVYGYQRATGIELAKRDRRGQFHIVERYVLRAVGRGGRCNMDRSHLFGYI